MISKEISLDEKVDALSDDTARLLFTWLIPHLDVEGRMYGDAQIFKSIVAPRRNYSIKKVEKSLEEMEKLGLVERYDVNGNRYLFAPNFEKHQIGMRKDKEAQSRIPPPNSRLSPELIQTQDGLSHSQIKEKYKLKRKEDKEEKNNSSNPLEDNQVNDVSEEMAKIATLYEAEIGRITYIAAEQLKEAIEEYPAGWIKNAIKEAVKQNMRKWSYVKGILENWKKVNRNKDLIQGQSIEKALLIARGKVEANPTVKTLIQTELKKRGIDYEGK